MKLRYAVLFSPCLFLLHVQPLPGQSIFNSFGPNDSYDAGSGRGFYWNVDQFGSSANVGRGVAAQFSVSSGAYSLNSVTLALGRFQDTNNFAISIRADNGNQPGALIETLASHPTNVAGLYEVVTYQSSLNPVMAGREKYWLTAEPVDLNVTNGENNAVFGWYLTGNGTLGLTALKDFDFSSQSWLGWGTHSGVGFPAFRVDALAVPEPSSLSLFLAGSILAGLRLRRKL
jgi:hypothetical protein